MGNVIVVSIHPASGSSSQAPSESEDAPRLLLRESQETSLTSAGSKEGLQMIFMSFLKESCVFWVPPFQYHSPSKKAFLFGYGQMRVSKAGLELVLSNSEYEESDSNALESGSCNGKVTAWYCRKSPKTLLSVFSICRRPCDS